MTRKGDDESFLFDQSRQDYRGFNYAGIRMQRRGLPHTYEV